MPAKEVKGRKPKVCELCGKRIEVGEVHLVESAFIRMLNGRPMMRTEPYHAECYGTYSEAKALPEAVKFACSRCTNDIVNKDDVFARDGKFLCGGCFVSQLPE